LGEGLPHTFHACSNGAITDNVEKLLPSILAKPIMSHFAMTPKGLIAGFVPS